MTRVDEHRTNGTNGHANEVGQHVVGRPHPQTTYISTSIEPDSFYGKIRSIYSEKVLKTQLEQMKKQGSYDAFRLKWHPAYDIRRLTGAKTRLDGIPPSLFWESDVGKWIEAVCYFLSSPNGKDCSNAAEFDACLKELVDMIETAQQADGYLNIYFTVVDPEGRFKNMRDMHEQYNAGHLLEGALAHHQYTGSKQFLNVMIKNVECLAKHIGPEAGQLHGYPGHPELELAVLRLYALTQDPKHFAFAEYLLSERGTKKDEFGGESYFVHEAQVRGDETFPSTIDNLKDLNYSQAHAPLHEQDAILGHSVRAFYLYTAAADLGGKFLEDAKRVWADCVDHKMYATGGVGTEPRSEGFSKIKYRLPQSTAEGGCYAETCASIALMMTSERILSHQLDGHSRDVMEVALLNAVLGGGSLNGKQFSYANKQATWGDETAIRKDWFEVCCCPPNLSRTLGMLGGYTWTSRVDTAKKTIHLDVYLFVSATKQIELPSGETATIKMKTSMPWLGETEWTVDAPDAWSWELRIPEPDYAADVKVSFGTTMVADFQVSTPTETAAPGFLSTKTKSKSSVTMSFSLPIRLLTPHPLSGQDTLTVTRGPIVYTAESIDNSKLDNLHNHFEGIGLTTAATFSEGTEEIEGVTVITLTADQGVYALNQIDRTGGFVAVRARSKARTWENVGEGLRLVPWFARANRGGAGRVRTAFIRADEALYQ